MKKIKWSLLLAILAVLVIITPTVWAADETLTIKGDGVEQETVFKRVELEKMNAAMKQDSYSLVNNFPTAKNLYASGIPLLHLLEQAGLKEEAQLITATATDGYRCTFTVQELLKTPRYYFPSSGAKKEVPTIICLKDSNKSLSDLQPIELKLVMGQRAPGEQNNPWYVKYLSQIEVSCAQLSQWPEVTFEQNSGKDGITLTLSHANFDSVKIYYTTDGSKPGLDSKMYNLSATYYQPELNKPILLNKKTTIRAIAIGAGKIDSQESSIVVFNDTAPAEEKPAVAEQSVVSEQPSAPVSVFNDLNGFEWARPAIIALTNDKLVYGIDDTHFDPNGSLTRSMFVTMLGRMLNPAGSTASSGAGSFPDVDYMSWYGPHVQWAVSKDIVSGYEDGNFRPNNYLTVEEMIIMAVRAKGLEAATSPDIDLNEHGISPWAIPYMITAEKQQLLERGHISAESANGITINGQKQANRAEAAVTLYRLMGRNEANVVSDAVSSTTLKPAQKDDQEGAFSFLFLSDTQANPETGDYNEFGKLLNQAVDHKGNPQLVLFGGDTVNNASDVGEWQDFWNAAKNPLSGKTTAAVAGNHDLHPLLGSQFSYPASDNLFYSFNQGDIHFIMLDSNAMGAANQSDISWLRSDLNSNEAKQVTWRVAVMHHPMWPVTANPKDIQRAITMRENFLPLLESGQVDLILCGHQQVYSRTKPMSGDKVSTGNGIVQIMAATGGKDAYTAEKSDHVAFIGEPPNYLLITANQQTLKVTAYGMNNTQLDSWVLRKD